MAQKYAKDQPSGFDNHVKNVAVVGVSGSVGEYITKHLLSTGKHTVTAITREGSKSEIPSGVKVAKVNYDQSETLVEALKGQQALIVTMRTGPDGQAASKKLAEAAAKANVPWIMPNEYGPDVFTHPDMGNESMLLPGLAAIRETVREQGVSSYLGLICGYWYEFSLANAPQSYGFDFKNKSWEQCGRAVASLLSLPQYPQDSNDKTLTISRWANDSVHVDSFFVNQRDMLDSILRVTGEKESDWKIEHQGAKERWEQGRAMMKEGGAKAGAGYIQTMYSRTFYKDGSGDYSHELDNERLGLPKEGLDEATKRALSMVEGGYNYFTRYQ